MSRLNGDKTEQNSAHLFIDAQEAIAAFGRGDILILIDDEDRENEGDLVQAAAHVTPASINFMATEGRGLVCISITEARAAALDLKPMVSRNSALLGTAFTESVDAVQGTTTGISAYDRAVTARVFVDPQAAPAQLARPGHLFPLVARNGGVLERPGHTEAVVDLANAAGLFPAGILCEIMDDDGRMARLPRLITLAETHGLKIASVADIVRYRQMHEQLVSEVARVQLPTASGTFQLHYYRSRIDPTEEHLALVMGDLGGDPPLVRVHSECLTGDTFGSLRCDCGHQLESAMKMVAEEGRGAILYMRQEGRGIGLANKMKAYALQENGKDTVEANEALGFKADHREYWFAAQMLKALGVTAVRLMTNNPRKVSALKRCGISDIRRVAAPSPSNPSNERYLRTKKEKLGHLLMSPEKA